MTEKSLSVVDFARKINRERTDIYYLFKRKSIDTEFLIQISKVLSYDFIHEVYFPKSSYETSSKILIAIEVDWEEIEKLNLPKDFICLVKPEK